MRFGILVGFLLIILGPSPVADMPIVPARLKPRKSDIPKGFRPFGPLGFTASVVRLNGRTVPAAVKAARTIGGIPPTYYELRTGRLIGAVAIDGTIWPTCPASLKKHPSLAVVVIRRRPSQNAYNVAYLPARSVRKLLGDWLQPSSITKLHIDTKMWQIVTMDYQYTAFPDRSCARSWVAATDRDVRVGYHRNGATYSEDCRLIATNFSSRATVLWGDGGRTITERGRDPKICLLFYRQPIIHSRYASINQ